MCLSGASRFAPPGPRIAAGGPGVAGVNGDALFEIRSTTKVFTALLQGAPLASSEKPWTLRSASPLMQAAPRPERRSRKNGQTFFRRRPQP
jgi:hypothetical protein